MVCQENQCDKNRVVRPSKLKNIKPNYATAVLMGS